MYVCKCYFLKLQLMNNAPKNCQRQPSSVKKRNNIIHSLVKTQIAMESRVKQPGQRKWKITGKKYVDKQIKKNLFTPEKYAKEKLLDTSKRGIRLVDARGRLRGVHFYWIF